MTKILGRITSINVRKVMWALDELGLPYEREDWGLPLRDPKVPQFLALNPNGQVPVFIEGEFVLWESNAILIYLAERAGQLLSTQMEPRALALQWLGWQASELNPSWGYAVPGADPQHARLRRPDKDCRLSQGLGHQDGYPRCATRQGSALCSWLQLQHRRYRARPVGASLGQHPFGQARICRHRGIL